MKRLAIAAVGLALVVGIIIGGMVGGVPGAAAQMCGDGIVDPGEECDDGDMIDGDGCSAACVVEPGWHCTGEPSVCTPGMCGDGIVDPGEECDDGNTAGGDGCASACVVEPGWDCTGEPSVCTPTAPVGGIAELPDVAGGRLGTDGSSGTGAGFPTWGAAGIAAAVALTAGAWYARRWRVR